MYRTLAKKCTEVEERGRLLENLKKRGVGLREIEEFITKEKEKFKGKGTFRSRKEIVQRMMMEKIRDNIRYGQGEILKKVGEQNLD